MLFYRLIPLLFIIHLNCYCQIKSKGYEIEVSLAQKPEGLTKAYLINSAKNVTIDSAEITAQVFKFSGVLQEPTLLMIKSGDAVLPMMLEEKELHVKVRTVSIDYLPVAEVTGSALNSVFNNYQKNIQQPYARNELVVAQAMFQSDMDHDSTAVDSLNKKIDSLRGNLIANIQKYIYYNNASPLSLYLLDKHLMHIKSSTAYALFGNLDDHLKRYSTGYKLEQYFKVFRPGGEAPFLTLKDTTHKEIAFTSFKGKTVLLDFSASWCGPCIKDLPELKRIYQTYQEKGFEIITVSLDTDLLKWNKFVIDNNITWTTLYDHDAAGKSLANIYNVTAIPSYFIIDKEGSFLDVNVPIASISAILDLELNNYYDNLIKDWKW